MKALSMLGQLRVLMGSPFKLLTLPWTPSHLSFKIGWSMMPRTGDPSLRRAMRVPNKGLPAARDQGEARESKV